MMNTSPHGQPLPNEDQFLNQQEMVKQLKVQSFTAGKLKRISELDLTENNEGHKQREVKKEPSPVFDF